MSVPLRRTGLSRVAIVGGWALAAAACSRADPVGSGPSDVRRPTANVAAATAGNGRVSADYNSLKGTLYISVYDPDGISFVQAAGLVAVGAQVEWSEYPDCSKLASTTRGNKQFPHNGHPHRVTWTDCQGRRREGDKPLEKGGMEMWEIPSGNEEAVGKTRRLTMQLDQNPRVLDANPGTKKFYGVVIGGRFIPDASDVCAKAAPEVRDALAKHANWQRNPSPITTLIEAQATRAAVTAAVDSAKKLARPGDEFLFYYCDHGTNSAPDAGVQDEVTGLEGRIHVAKPGAQPPYEEMTDDELTLLLSGFKDSVTLTVVIDACNSGAFVNGAADLLNITSDARRRLNKDHLAVLMSSLECSASFNAAFSRALIACINMEKAIVVADVNKDGITTSEELFECMRPRTSRQFPQFARGVGP